MDETLLAKVSDCLRDGGVVLLPTDTVYGLAVHPERPDAIDRLFAMKKRPSTTNLPIMVAAAEDITALGAVVGDEAARLLAAYSPGPLTLALGLRAEQAPGWLRGRVEIGVRIPDDAPLRRLLTMTGPLLVTSANAHSHSTREAVPDILADLAGEPDLVVDDGVRPVVPSTLVNCNLPVPRIEREGVLSAARIMEVIG